MSASSAQLQFAAEFVLFLAAASGLAVMALRGALLSEKSAGEFALTAGFLALGTSAFLHGSRLVDDGGSAVIVGVRTLGIAGVLAGCLWGWVAGQAGRVLLGVAVAFIAAATFVDSGESGTFSLVALATGGLALGAAVLLASRRSIAARVAATAATTLLIVVLVLGVAISAVLVNTVQNSAVDRIVSRAENEAAKATNQSVARIREARVVAAFFRNDLTTPKLLAAKTATEPSNILTDLLRDLSSTFLADVSLAYVANPGLVHGVARLDNVQVVALAGTPVVTEALNSGDERGSIELLGNEAFSIGVEPVGSQRTDGLVGVAVALSKLDDSYLTQVAVDDKDLSLALVKNTTTVVARHGSQPTAPSIAGMVRTALVDGRTSKGVVGGRFVAVAPVKVGNGRPQLALVASSLTTLVNRTRDDLFRNLFLVALGGALLALLFAVVIGARIGAGLGRLRTAAEAIQRGDFGVRAGIESADEVGVLSRAFDSMASSVQDKTAAEAQMRGRLEAVVAGMGEALVALDPMNLVTDFNQAAEDLLGMRQSEALGRPVEDIVRLSDKEGAPISVMATPGSALRWSAVGTVETTDGRQVPVSLSVGVLRGPEAATGGKVLVLADLTREREVEQMKKEFLSRVGHELRHPLVPLMGYAEILNRKDVPREQARVMLTEMLDQSRKLLRIVEMLEFFAAAGAGQMSLRLEEVDPRSVVDDVVRRWQQRLGDSDVIRPRVRRATPTVMADLRRLTKCVDELVDNAVKFSVNGGKIVVAAEPGSDGGVEISVTDRGQGMTAAEQEKAFDDFVQGDPSDTRPHGGLGLGLAFVRRVTEAHGGSLSCESILGKGSKFSIVVPDVPKDTAR